VQLLFDAQKLGDFLFLDGGHGHAGPARHHVLDVVLGDDAGRSIVEVVAFAQHAQVLALLALLVRVETRLLELVVAMAFSIRCTMNLMRFWISETSEGSVVWRSLTRAPASSMRSMALSAGSGPG